MTVLRSNFVIRRRSHFTHTYVHILSSVLFSILFGQFNISRLKFIIFHFTESARTRTISTFRTCREFSVLTQKCYKKKKKIEFTWVTSHISLVQKEKAAKYVHRATKSIKNSTINNTFENDILIPIHKSIPSI